MKTIIGIVYLVIGVIVASTHHYFVHLGSIKSIASAVLAVLLWPLVLFGVNLHLGHFSTKALAEGSLLRSRGIPLLR